MDVELIIKQHFHLYIIKQKTKNHDFDQILPCYGVYTKMTSLGILKIHKLTPEMERSRWSTCTWRLPWDIRFFFQLQILMKIHSIKEYDFFMIPHRMSIDLQKHFVYQKKNKESEFQLTTDYGMLIVYVAILHSRV